MTKNIERELKNLNKSLKDVVRLLQRKDERERHPKGILTEPLKEPAPSSFDEIVEAVSGIKNQEETE